MGSAFGLRCQVSRHPGQQTDGGDSHSRSWRGQEVVSKHLSPRNRQARPDWLHGSPAGREKGQPQRRGDRLCSPSSHLPHSQKHFAIFMQLGAFPSFCPCAWGAKIQLSFSLLSITRTALHHTPSSMGHPALWTCAHRAGEGIGWACSQCARATKRWERSIQCQKNPLAFSKEHLSTK